jgi:SHS2 domain-containing protein
LKVRARDLKTLFLRSAAGMNAIVIDPKTVRNEREIEIGVEEDSIEELFLSWLKEILYQIEKLGMVFSQFDIKEDNFAYSKPEKYRITGKLGGEKINPIRHEICMEIKAVTRHGFSLKKKGSHWESKTLFDI